MKKIAALILLFGVALGLFSCMQIDPQFSITGTGGQSFFTTKPTASTTVGKGTTIQSNPTSGTTTTASGTTSDKLDEDVILNPEIDEEELFAELFSYENHVTLYLDITNSELKKISDDFTVNSKSPIYRMADLHVTISKPDGTVYKFVIDQVGVRMKGNTSRRQFCNSDGMYDLVHFKVSFQETFDDPEHYGDDVMLWSDAAAREERKDRTFATLEKIDMRWNKNYDATHIREIYAYDIYRAHGVLAPHVNLASVDVGSVHAGVWTFYEPIDKIFLEKNLPAEALGGDLYKLGWTSEGATFTSFTSYGVEDELAGEFYVYDLKTNKKKSDHSSLKNLITVINSSSCNKESFASVVDVDNFLMFAAVSYIIGNPDDLRNNYNNCYIYFRGDNGKMMLIPYDLDRGLGVNKDWNPSGNHMTTDSPFSDQAIGNGYSAQKNPLFTKGILNESFFKNEYINALRTVGTSDIIKIPTFEDHYLLAKSLYSDDVYTSKNLGSAGNGVGFNITNSDDSNMSYSEYITQKTQTLASYISEYTPDVGTSAGSELDGDDSGNSGSQTTVTEWELYVRGNFDNNDWSNHSEYKLAEIAGGIYSVTLTATSSSGDAGTFKFKIYNEKQSGDSAWYNTVDKSKINTEFEYQGGNRNIQVALGTYTIYFDTNTQTIYFEQQ